MDTRIKYISTSKLYMSRGLRLFILFLILSIGAITKSYSQAQLCATAPIIENPALEDTSGSFASLENGHPCQDSVPVFFVDLTGVPDSAWSTEQFDGEAGPNSPGNYVHMRGGINKQGALRYQTDEECETCCDFSPNSKKTPSDNSNNNRCIGFVVTLDPGTSAIRVEYTGAGPGILEWTAMDFGTGTCSLPKPVNEDIV